MEFTPHMTERHKARYAVRPGLECPRVGDEEPEAGIDYAHARFENDVDYVESVSVYCQALADKIGVMISTLSAFCVPTAFPTSEICQA